MAQFFEFLAQQWMLSGALAACIVLLIQHESRRGGPSLTPQQLINRVNQDEAVIIDLRDPKEYKEGHIVDAMNIPHAKLQEKLGELESCRGKPLILVCKIGQHAGAAGKLLRANGFDDVSRLRGGMTEWNGSQLPLVSQ